MPSTSTKQTDSMPPNERASYKGVLQMIILYVIAATILAVFSIGGVGTAAATAAFSGLALAVITVFFFYAMYRTLSRALAAQPAPADDR